MEFGIYPGGPVGTVNITDSPVPEDASSRLKALDMLRSHTASGKARPFVVRLYESFTGDAEVDAFDGTGVNAVTDAEVQSLSKSGFDIDLVIRYQPMSSLGAQALDDYLEFLRTVTERYGANRHVRFLQIANEVNVPSSETSSDGAYPGATTAVVWGVETAAQEAAADGFSQIKVGFNWAYVRGARPRTPLWRLIRSQGVAFQKSLGWVGLDDYPGTFSDVGVPGGRTGSALAQGVEQLRRLMRESGISNTVPIHVTETGYPTGPKRSRKSQVVALSSLVNSVNDVRGRFDVTQFEWFDLRDSNTSIPNEQEQYGLMTSTYQVKPAFRTYKRLVSRLGR